MITSKTETEFGIEKLFMPDSGGGHALPLPATILIHFVDRDAQIVLESLTLSEATVLPVGWYAPSTLERQLGSALSKMTFRDLLYRSLQKASTSAVIPVHASDVFAMIRLGLFSLLPKAKLVFLARTRPQTTAAADFLDKQPTDMNENDLNEYELTSILSRAFEIAQVQAIAHAAAMCLDRTATLLYFENWRKDPTAFLKRLLKGLREMPASRQIGEIEPPARAAREKRLLIRMENVARASVVAWTQAAESR